MADQELAYYFTLFKRAGHETWRMDVSKKLLAKDVTEKIKYRVERITGKISQVK